jgi:hypothetical protein
MNGARPDEEIEILCRQLAELEQERARLEIRIAELKHRKVTTELRSQECPPPVTGLKPSVTNGSLSTDKVALFCRLFGGRTDVFPARWDNPKTGRSGYAPACANEWVRGVCGKPQVKCGDCPNKAFIPVRHRLSDLEADVWEFAFIESADCFATNLTPHLHHLTLLSRLGARQARSRRQGGLRSRSGGPQ